MNTRGSVIGLALALALGCSAHSEVAEPLDVVMACPTSDQKLQRLVELADEGKLDGLKTALSQRLLEGRRTQVIDLAFDMIRALPPDTFSDLRPAVDSGTLEGLIAFVRVPLRTIVKEQAYPELALVGRLLHECRGLGLLMELQKLLTTDEQFRQDLLSLLNLASELRVLLDEQLGLDLTDFDHREGVQALLRLLVHTLSQPGFDIGELTGEDGLLGLLGPIEEPTIVLLIRVAETLLEAGERLEAIQLVTTCLLEQDPDDQLFGLLFDLILAGADEPASAAVPSLDIYPGGPLEAVDRLVLPLLGLVTGDRAVREALVGALGALLREDVARLFLPDLIVLIDSGALQDTLELLVSLARGGGC